MKHTKQQKIADIQRILTYLIDDFELLWEVFPDEEHQIVTNIRLKEIKSDLDYGKLRYHKEE